MHKRASLSLSINAIVILVLAITMLGLGLGFTKGMFSKFSSKLEVPPPNIPATPEEPIVLPQETVEVLKNKDFDLTVNFYNDYESGPVTPGFDCTGELQGIEPQYAPQTVEPGTYKPFKFLFTAINRPGKSVCTITFTPTGGSAIEKQIVIISK